MPILLIAAVVPCASAHSQVTVSLRAEAVVFGRLIRVDDVARVEGGEAALVQRVSSVLIGTVPKPGDIKTLARNHIRARIHQEGLSLSRIAVRGQKWVAVASSSRDGEARAELSEISSRRATDVTRANDLSDNDARGRPRLVETGGRVTVLLETAFLRIADEAEALKPGAAGELIPVRNLRSGKTFLARVIDDHTVAATP